MKVVIFSYHYFESRRRAGFHHLAQAFWELGWDVFFVTAPLSRLSFLARDERLEYPVVREANRVKVIRERLASYVLFSLVHPANLRIDSLNRLTGRLLVTAYRRSRLGSLKSELANADLIVFESTPAIVLAPLVRKMAPRARLVYRVSDDLEILRVHPAVLAAEREALADFDFVSAPSRYSAEKLGTLTRVDWQPHAVAKHMFDEACDSPYGDGVNAVWVGHAALDEAFVDSAADSFPDWTFHIIGPPKRADRRPNVIWHGELPFERTIPFLRHGDIALAAYGGPEGRIRGYLADSLKIVQYAYCGLPIVAPSALQSDRPHVFYYEPGDGASVTIALRAALAAGKRPELGQSAPSWRELATTLAGTHG